jgi:hypothetical protein
LPLASNVAVCKNRTLDIDPVELNEPVSGSYNSADARDAFELSTPPVIRTLPLASKVAVCAYRALGIDSVELNEPWGAAVMVGVGVGVAAGASVGVAVDVVVAVAVWL